MLTDLDRIARINELVAEWQGSSFEWGRRDCATLAADAVYRLTGTRPIDPWPDYDSAKSALRAIKRAGFQSFDDAVTANLSRLEPLQPSLIGDLMAIRTGDDAWPFALGVNLGGGAVFVATEGVFRSDRANNATGDRWGVR